MLRKKKTNGPTISYSDIGNPDKQEEIRRWLSNQNNSAYTQPKKLTERFGEWVDFAPAPNVLLCKILKFVLDIGGFAFLVLGGIAMLPAAWDVVKAVSSDGLRGTLNMNTLRIISYFAILFLINKLRWLMLRITNRI